MKNIYRCMYPVRSYETLDTLSLSWIKMDHKAVSLLKRALESSAVVKKVILSSLYKEDSNLTSLFLEKLMINDLQLGAHSLTIVEAFSLFMNRNNFQFRSLGVNSAVNGEDEVEYARFAAYSGISRVVEVKLNVRWRNPKIAPMLELAERSGGRHFRVLS